MLVVRNVADNDYEAVRLVEQLLVLRVIGEVNQRLDGVRKLVLLYDRAENPVLDDADVRDEIALAADGARKGIVWSMTHQLANEAVSNVSHKVVVEKRKLVQQNVNQVKNLLHQPKIVILAVINNFLIPQTFKTVISMYKIFMILLAKENNQITLNCG